MFIKANVYRPKNIYWNCSLDKFLACGTSLFDSVSWSTIYVIRNSHAFFSSKIELVSELERFEAKFNCDV